MILIALQGMHAIEYDDSAARDQLDELAVAIDKAPSSWNWCIRRKRLHRQFLWGTFPKAPGEYISSGSMHKLMTPGSHQGRLFSMTLPNVEIAPDKAIACGFYDGGSSLAAMLKVSRVLISHSSSTAAPPRCSVSLQFFGMSEVQGCSRTS
jgi:hypothetical protein